MTSRLKEKKMEMTMMIVSILVIWWEKISASRPILPSPADSPCSFNALCTCSKPGPDLGLVTCDDVPLFMPPKSINSTSIYILILRRNFLYRLEDRSFFGTGISRLEITDNFLTDLPSGALHGLDRSLRELSLERNRLTSIPTLSLSRLSRLRDLNLNHNRISDIRAVGGGPFGLSDFPPNLKGCLKTLRLAYNSLTYLDAFSLSSLESLQHLDVSGNNLFALHLMSFGVGGSPDAINAQASPDFFTTGSGYMRRGRRTPSSSSTSSPADGRHPHFDYLQDDSSSSGSSSSWTSSLPNLEYLNLSKNRLTKIPFESIQNLSKLKVLDLRCNLIKATSDMIDYKNKKRRKLTLETLHLDLNRIDILSEDAFENFFQINELTLSRNPIRMIEDYAFRGLKLAHLDLRGCLIDSMSFWAWTGLEKDLKYLDLTDNVLSTSTQSVVRTDDRVTSGHHPPPTGLIFFNDSFSNLESLQRFFMNSGRFDDDSSREDHQPLLTPLSLLSSQYSLQELSLKCPSHHPYRHHRSPRHPPHHHPRPTRLSPVNIEPFDPSKYEMHFPSIRRLSLGPPLIHPSRLLKGDLIGFGDYSLEDIDLSNCDLEEVEEGAFDSCPSLKSLNLADNRIRKLDGLKSIGRSLITLDLHNGLKWSQPLDCRPFDHLLSLQFVNLMNNGIESMSRDDCFRHLSQVKILLLDFNSLKVLSNGTFSSLTDLSYVGLSFNRLSVIKSMTFNELDGLEIIDLSFNQIELMESMSFANLRSLRVINLESNDLQVILSETFYYLPRLEMLNLSFNRVKILKSTSFDQVGTLTTFSLFLNDNQLGGTHHQDPSSSSSLSSSFPERLSDQRPEDEDEGPQVTLLSLERLDLSNNNLTGSSAEAILRPLLSSVKNSIIYLNLRNNQLGPDISPNLVSNLKSLQTLDLRSNSISRVHPLMLESNSNVQILLLDDNKLSQLPVELLHDLTSLRILSIRQNVLFDLPDHLLKGSSSTLQVINTSGNRLSTLPVCLEDVRLTLRILDVSDNDITSIDMEGQRMTRGDYDSDDYEIERPSSRRRLRLMDAASFPVLLHLDLSRNRIRSIRDESFSIRFPSLQILDLSFNPLRVVSDGLFDGLNTLRSLSLSGCLFKSIPMLNLPNLTSLNLSHNLISSPNSISISNITDLHDLDISFNRLSVSPNNLWPQVNRLRSLNISSNPIHILHEESFLGLDSLEVLSMVNLTRLSSMASKSLYPLFNVKRLDISSYPTTRKGTSGSFNMSTIIEDLSSLRELIIHINDESDLKLGHPLPLKLSNIRIIGNGKMTRIPSDTFVDVRSNFLHISLTGTNITSIDGDFDLSESVKMISIDVSNNRLTSIPDLLTGSRRNGNFRNKKKVTFLEDLQSLSLSGNDLTCDCSTAWMLDWIRDLKSSSLSTLMTTINNLNSDNRSHKKNDINFILSDIDSSILNSSSPVLSSGYMMPTSMVDPSETDKYLIAMGNLRAVTCSTTSESILSSFRKDLRDCLRSRSPRTVLELSPIVICCYLFVLFSHN